MLALRPLLGEEAALLGLGAIFTRYPYSIYRRSAISMQIQAYKQHRWVSPM